MQAGSAKQLGGTSPLGSGGVHDVGSGQMQGIPSTHRRRFRGPRDLEGVGATLGCKRAHTAEQNRRGIWWSVSQEKEVVRGVDFALDTQLDYSDEVYFIPDSDDEGIGNDKLHMDEFVDDSLLPLEFVEDSLLPVEFVQDSLLPIEELLLSAEDSANDKSPQFAEDSIKEKSLLAPANSINDSLLPTQYSVDDSLLPVEFIKDSLLPVQFVQDSLFPIEESLLSAEDSGNDKSPQFAEDSIKEKSLLPAADSVYDFDQFLGVDIGGHSQELEDKFMAGKNGEQNMDGKSGDNGKEDMMNFMCSFMFPELYGSYKGK